MSVDGSHVSVTDDVVAVPARRFAGTLGAVMSGVPVPPVASVSEIPVVLAAPPSRTWWSRLTNLPPSCHSAGLSSAYLA